MAASEAAVTAVMETLGCEQDEFAGHYCAGSCSVRDAFGEWVPAEWSPRGCEVAVAAADAAVDADRASIQAEALREAANAAAPALANEVGGHTSTYSVRQWLRERADRIEGKP